MGFLKFINPFHKESANDYAGVVVPLARAIRHPTVVAEYARRCSSRTSSSVCSDGSRKDNTHNEEGVMRSNSLSYSPYTIEGLRAEINAEMALVPSPSGKDSEYECKIRAT